MITKEDISVLYTYFESLESIPEELTTIVNKINLMKTIQEANDDLMELMKDGE